MAFEQWAEGYFGKDVDVPEACRDAWNASIEHQLAACEALNKQYREALEFVKYIYAEEPSATAGAQFDRGLSISKETIRNAQNALAIPLPADALNNAIAEELERMASESYELRGGTGMLPFELQRRAKELKEN